MPEKPSGEMPEPVDEQKEEESTLERALIEVSESAKSKLREIRKDAENRFPEVFEKSGALGGNEIVLSCVREAAKGETHYDFVLEPPYDYIYDSPQALERDQLLATRDKHQPVEVWKEYINSAVRVTNNRGDKMLLFVDAANFYNRVKRLGLKISVVNLGSSDTRFGMASSSALRVEWGEKESE